MRLRDQMDAMGDGLRLTAMVLCCFALEMWAGTRARRHAPAA